MAVVSTATSLALSPAVGTFLPSSSPSSPSSTSLSLRSLFLSLPNKPGFLSVGRRQQRIGDVTGRVFRRAAGVTMSLEAGIGVMGTKLGMMTYFEPQGAAVPVTVVGFREGNIVTQVKTGATDGYEAVQVGYRRVRDKKLTKPELGHLQKAGTIPMRHLQEFRLQSADGFEPGQKLAMDEIFKEGDLVDISGTSIGKGFQGGIKRHNFRRGLMTHGSKSHRALGSIGAGTTPGRVYKGKKMPGRMGGAKTKIRKLKIVKIDNDLRVMMIKGAVPDEMNVLNYQYSPASGINGQYYYSVLPARPSCSKYYHRPQHRSHQDYACHRDQHLLPVALTLPPPPLPASPPRSVQPSRSSCSPTPPLAVGNSINNIGGSPLQRDDHHEPLIPIHRSAADHDAVVDEELMGPLITSGTLGFVDVRSLMDDDVDDEYRYLRQQTSQKYYYHTAGSSHLDRPQRQHQQLLLSPDQEPAPPRVVLTLAVSVASAVKLQSKQMDQIAKKMRKLTGFEHLRMENTVDPSLIAGFVIRYGGDDAHHVIDLSVKGRLAEMEARLQSADQTGAGAASFPGMH